MNTADKKHLNIGIYAHVDAGKTTLSEALLYLAGVVRKSGRVDHGDTFFDTYDLERKRGITIFSKQAELDLTENTHITLLDTPGHADFAPETERTMKVLDLAILIISAADGVTSQVQTLWKLLEHYEVPIFIFVNKMDQNQADKTALLSDIQKRLSAHALDFSETIISNVGRGDSGLYSEADASLNEDFLGNDEFQEELAVCDDELLNAYLEDGRKVVVSDIQSLISTRRLFPCLFGSALKMEGVKELMFLIDFFSKAPVYPEDFAARVYKISRDSGGTRLSWLKIMGGTLHVRDILSMPVAGSHSGAKSSATDNSTSEKVDQIRVYSGDKYELLQEAKAGQIVAVTGLDSSYAGQGLGALTGELTEVLAPILSSRIILPEGADPFTVYKQLLELSEEEPLLDVKKDDVTGDLSIQVMGEVQMEILKHRCIERYGLEIGFGPGSIVYKETIKAPVEGVGHFEPLRHYAEAHLLLTPTEPGSGLSFDADCPVDDLAVNWQNLILSHLEEFKIRGVLTGSEITDMRITVIGGRSHLKHTEGGDFREATMRAVRQGLMMAENILLEPVYDFVIELPTESVGRAISDIQKMSGTTNPPDLMSDGISVLTGSVPASELHDYAAELLSYTHGQGRLNLSLHGYEPCHNAEAIIEEKAYDPERDIEQPTGSVFCSHGAGTVIPWDEVRSHMHVDTGWTPDGEGNSSASDTDLTRMGDALKSFKSDDLRKEAELTYEERTKAYNATIQELDSIFERTYGPVKPRYDAKADEERKRKAANKAPEKKYRAKEYSPDDSYLLVDGYNIIYANDELRALADSDMKSARDKLMDILSNFQGYRRETVILVFDAYRVPGGTEHVLKYHNLDVVFTKEAETADQYIERTAHKYSRKNRVTVATSDAIEQVIIYGAGAMRMSASDFWYEIKRTEDEIRDRLSQTFG
ncbi:translation factor GTPase family protein [Butyrivibrio sp. FC2001]|uniref:translation factor GTPase family protein n=1 Tax=Butyrivibrio sp. FC2001 TaxID=1280671 RepID=UPI0004248115|nr:TetM/TetW/TetO/TetS family tetracycline resistance ribosomal protection protein [Butyrivibrio sp. FC2001]